MKFKPEGNQYFTAPRDAFKLHKCSGNIAVHNMYIEGVRMDGQNMHSNYLFPLEFISNDTVKFFTIDVHDAQDVYVRNCKFECINEKMRIDTSSSSNINFE